MPFPWLHLWPLQYKHFIGKRYYFLEHRSTDKTCTKEKRQNVTLIGRCVTVMSGPRLSRYISYVELLLIIFVEFVTCGSHGKMSSILALHYFWKHSAGVVALFILNWSSRWRWLIIHTPHTVYQRKEFTGVHYLEKCLDPRTGDIR